MFTVEYVPTRIRRISIGFAVAALAVTSFVAPLSASAHEVSHASTVMAIGQTGDPPPGPNTPVAVPKKADIKVVARGKSN